MDTVEQLLTVAKNTATTDEQKKRAQILSVVYDMTKMQDLQSQVAQLQSVLQYSSVSSAQREYITHAIDEAMSEISRLHTSLNNECMEQITDFL